jgi:hypothetical protein
MSRTDIYDELTRNYFGRLMQTVDIISKKNFDLITNNRKVHETTNLMVCYIDFVLYACEKKGN